MKKGFTLIELMVMVVIAIMGILSAVAVPKIFAMACESKDDQCRIQSPEIYKEFCQSKPEKCDNEFLISMCTTDPTSCMRNGARAWNLAQVLKLQKRKQAAEKRQQEAPKPAPAPKTVDTVVVIQEEPKQVLDDTQTDFVDCIKKCTRENSAESLVDFCIKENCKE